MAKAKKKKATPKVARKASTGPRGKNYGLDMRIIKLPGENWRREGTANHTRAKELMAFMKKKPTASVAEALAATTYRRQDLEWDIERGVVRTAKVNPKFKVTPKVAKASKAKRAASNGATESATA